MKSSAPVTGARHVCLGLPGSVAGGAAYQHHKHSDNKTNQDRTFYHFSNDICMWVCPPPGDGEWVIVKPVTCCP